MEIRSVGIAGVGSYVPERILTNDELEQMVDTSDEWIRTRTGISTRHIAAENQATSDLAYEAAKIALEDAGLKAEELDLIIVATSSPDMLFPATSCILQEKLGIKGKPSFDMEAACSGFIYGLAVGAQFIATGIYENVLVVGAETLSRLVDWEDRNTCVLFGDGAGAAVLRPVEKGKGLLSFYLGADGGGGDLLKVAAGGAALPASCETVENRLHFISMKGNEVYKFAVRVMGSAAVTALEKAGLSKDDVSFVVPHQANIRIVEAAMRRLGLPMEKAFINLNKYGNMSSASIPVALDELYRTQKLKEDDILVLVGFGAGLTWGSAVIKWNK
ncbi:ketoacyl-ACP synthase III [Dehalobacterium formicoaceticum]|uniref:Beta-ketoacyl-[acyl-carrier-protein] synthase III n=1 Tax=Dehalobacterium formicoaceticum TaxID=51515 RepID=A0ABT1Y0U0_9FIRM|nr:beta-ketoacyl-ACP synthase III [Dehalobacterium formicoaceticum]MCR6544193.1 ketoacyl-ACP synthase III [Dehalobacterium formicoaceticum]